MLKWPFFLQLIVMKHQCVEIVKKYVAKGKKLSSHFSSEMCEDFSSLNVRNQCAEIVLEFSSQFSSHLAFEENGHLQL